jgi:hypothetical protein
VAAKPQPKQTTTTTELIMSITVDKKIATGLLGKATNGNELMSVLDMIINSFTKPAVNTTPTLEEIEF